MKPSLANVATAWLVLLSSLTSMAQDSAPELDAEALAASKASFDNYFVQKEGSFLEKYFPSYGYSQDYWIMQFKGVHPAILKDHLSETDQMNGVTWRGQVTFEAAYQRVFSSEGTAHKGLKAEDWGNANSLLTVHLEKRGGKWIPTLRVGNENARPTETDLHEFDLGIQQLPADDKSRSSNPWLTLFEEAANGYAQATLSNSGDLVVLEMPPAKIKALGGSEQASKFVREDKKLIGRGKAEIQQVTVRPLKEPDCALGIARVVYHDKDKSVERTVIAYSNSGGLNWWFVGTSEKDQGFLREASGGKLPAGPLSVEKDGKWVFGQ